MDIEKLKKAVLAYASGKFDAVTAAETVQLLAEGAAAYLDEHPEPNPEHEAVAARFRAGMRETEDGKPDGTREGLAKCVTMIETWLPECLPANAKGQVHFARAMMESVSDEIAAYLKATGNPA